METMTESKTVLPLYRCQADGPDVLISEIFVTKEHPKQIIYLNEDEHFVVELRE